MFNIKKYPEKSAFSKQTFLDVLILLIIPAFLVLLHIFSKNFSLMFNDNLLVFANSYNVIQLMADGSFPLRDPYLYMDIIRASNVSILYWPHTFFYLICAKFFSANIEIIRLLWLTLHFIHICLPSICMYFLLRYCRFSRLASIFGGIVYGWNLYMLIMGGIYTAHMRAVHMAVIPLVWLITMYSLNSKKYYINILSGLLLGWSILAGGLQPAIYIIPFISLYLFFGLLLDKPFSVGNVFRAIGIPFFVIFLMILCSLSLIVTAPEILPYLNRPHANAVSSLFSMGEFFHGFIEPFVQWKTVDNFPWETAHYFGFIAILLSLVGFIITINNIVSKKSSSFEKWFLVVFIFSFTVSVFYAYFPQWFLKLLLFQKGFSRFPFRLYSLVMFSVAFFVAKGLDYSIAIHIGKSKKARYLFIIVLLVGVLFFLLRIWLHNPVLGGDKFFLFHNAIILLSLICLALIYIRPKYSWFIIFFLICDLSIVAYVYCSNRFQAYGLAKQDLYKHSFLRLQDQKWISQLPKTEIPYRILILGPDVYGEEGEVNRETGYVYNKLRHPFGYCGSTSIYRLNKFRAIDNLNHPIFDLLGVKFFYKKEKGKNLNSDYLKYIDMADSQVLVNQNVLPLIFAANKIKVFKDNPQLLEALYKGEDRLKNTVYLSADDLGEETELFSKFSNIISDETPKIRLDSVVYKSNKVEFSILAPSDIILVLSEPWLPFWKASIDGKETKIHQAYGILQAISVPKGSHSVRFNYTFPIYLIFISTISQIVLIFLAVAYAKK